MCTAKTSLLVLVKEEGDNLPIISNYTMGDANIHISRVPLTLQMTPSQSKMKTSTLSKRFSEGSVSFITFAMLIAVLLKVFVLLIKDTNAGLVERKVVLVVGVLNPDTREEDVAYSDASKVLENLMLF